MATYNLTLFFGPGLPRAFGVPFSSVFAGAERFMPAVVPGLGPGTPLRFWPLTVVSLSPVSLGTGVAFADSVSFSGAGVSASWGVPLAALSSDTLVAEEGCVGNLRADDESRSTTMCDGLAAFVVDLAPG